MKEVNVEAAATSLQRHYENVVFKDESLTKAACFGKFSTCFLAGRSHLLASWGMVAFGLNLTNSD